MARPKSTLSDDQTSALAAAAETVTTWRDTEARARHAVVAARRAGVPLRTIADATGLPHTTVVSWVERHD